MNDKPPSGRLFAKKAKMMMFKSILFYFTKLMIINSKHANGFMASNGFDAIKDEGLSASVRTTARALMLTRLEGYRHQEFSFFTSLDWSFGLFIAGFWISVLVILNQDYLPVEGLSLLPVLATLLSFVWSLGISVQILREMTVDASDNANMDFNTLCMQWIAGLSQIKLSLIFLLVFFNDVSDAIVIPAIINGGLAIFTLVILNNKLERIIDVSLNQDEMSMVLSGLADYTSGRTLSSLLMGDLEGDSVTLADIVNMVIFQDVTPNEGDEPSLYDF